MDLGETRGGNIHESSTSAKEESQSWRGKRGGKLTRLRVYLTLYYNTIIPWLLSAACDNAQTEGKGECGTKLSQVYYVL